MFQELPAHTNGSAGGPFAISSGLEIPARPFPYIYRLGLPILPFKQIIIPTEFRAKRASVIVFIRWARRFQESAKPRPLG
jgi:hypothetical protein